MNIVQGGLYFICAFQFDFGWSEVVGAVTPNKGTDLLNLPALLDSPSLPLETPPTPKGAVHPLRVLGRNWTPVTPNLWYCPLPLCFRGDGGHFGLIFWSTSFSFSMHCQGLHCQVSQCCQYFHLGHQKKLLLSQNHRMVYVGRDLKAHPAPPSTMGRDILHQTRLL